MIRPCATPDCPHEAAYQHRHCNSCAVRMSRRGKDFIAWYTSNRGERCLCGCGRPATRKRLSNACYQKAKRHSCLICGTTMHLHRRCTGCGILIGPGHLEREADRMGRCVDCAAGVQRQRRRAA